MSKYVPHLFLEYSKARRVCSKERTHTIPMGTPCLVEYVLVQVPHQRQPIIANQKRSYCPECASEILRKIQDLTTENMATLKAFKSGSSRYSMVINS